MQTTTTTFVASLLTFATTALTAEIGATGVIETLDAGFQGNVEVVAEDQVRITDYTLEDASAPALYWWGSKVEDMSQGFRINTEQVTEEASGETITVELNNGYSASDFEYFSLWCEQFALNFGQTQLQGGDGTPSSPADDSASDSDNDSNNNGQTQPQSAAPKTAVASVAALSLAAAFAAYLA